MAVVLRNACDRYVTSGLALSKQSVSISKQVGQKQNTRFIMKISASW